MKKDLAGFPKKVLEFIISYQNRHQYSPSINEIRDAVGLHSLRGVSIQLEKLEGLGFIQRNKRTRRSISILNTPPELTSEEEINVPVVGEVRAGVPTLAEQNVIGYEKVPLSLLKGRRDAFILKVKGDSMIEKNIKPGDSVVVVPQSTALNGDIVVALNPEEDEATLKIFKKLENYIVLLPANRNYKPIIGRQFVIQGKVVGKLPN